MEENLFARLVHLPNSERSLALENIKPSQGGMAAKQGDAAGSLETQPPSHVQQE